MPRRNRFADGGYVYHVLNRAAGRRRIFETEQDYAAFQKVIEESRHRTPMRVLCYCLMPNHWHLVLWPAEDGQLSEYMQWLTMTHTQRWNAFHEAVGTGPLYQGRFKSFPIAGDEHFFSVCRYVERNALRASLVSRAERWKWSSLWQRANDSYHVTLNAWPTAPGEGWMEYVNGVETEAELAAIRNSVKRGTPYGGRDWQRETATRLGLERTLNPRGRPRKG